MIGQALRVLAVASAAAGAAHAQSKPDLQRLVTASLPERETLAFEYLLSTNLAPKGALSATAIGRFAGPSHAEYTLETSAWGQARQTRFLAGPSGVAFLEVPPPRGAPAGWRSYSASAEIAREPTYAHFLPPQVLLIRLPEYCPQLEDKGLRGASDSETRVYVGTIDPDRVQRILAENGMALQANQKIESAQGTAVLWVGAGDGLLQTLEVSLVARIEETKKHDPAGAAPPPTVREWDFGNELDPDQGLMFARMRNPEAPESSTGGSGASEKTERPEKTFTVRMNIHRPGEGVKPADPIQPEPEAARLVNW